MTLANINRFILCLRTAFDALSANVPVAQLEEMAVLVHSAMESPQRRYHVSGHALYMCEGMAPRQVLAAVFHDIIYYQLDHGFPARLAPLFTPVVCQRGQELVLLRPEAGDRPLQLCLDLFGFAPGQVLPLFGGMNEFLSAVVAVRLLQPHIGIADLIAVVACIEATVPFRGPDAQGRGCSELLAQRLREQARLQLAAPADDALEAWVLGVMREAVGIANRDVAGFSESEPGRFVSGTWLLIEESNAPLAAVGVYTLQDYRQALMRMLTFLDSLIAGRVFQHYGGAPEEQTFRCMALAAGANIAFASSFLRLKISSIAVIEALALATGGNGPVSMFLGDIRSEHGRPQRIEDLLPGAPDATGLDDKLLDLLEKGRPQDSRNDLTVSPLTAWMYRCLGARGCANTLARARRMFAGDIGPREFLAHLQAAMLTGIIDACADIAVSRRERLLALKAELYPPP